MSSPSLSGGVSAPDAGESRTYRQHLRAGRRPILACLLVMVGWTLVGAVVVGQLRLPAADRLAWSLVVVGLWLGPPAVLLIPPLVGPRGPFLGWWWPRLIVCVDDRGVAWWTEDAVRRPADALEWSAVAAVRPTRPSRDRPPGSDCAVVSPEGRVLAALPCRLVRIDRPVSGRDRWRRVVWLPDIVVAVRPDRYRRRRVLGRQASLRHPDAG